MELLLSPWYIGLSALSLLITLLHLWGLRRACTRHNSSMTVLLCGNAARLPNRGVLAVAALYATLTVTYIVIPPLFHSLLLL